MLQLKNKKKKIKIRENIILIGFYKNKFKKILVIIIDSKTFGHKNKIGKFKYIYIKDLVNNVKNNGISEISVKEGLNTLNEIKNAEIIKYKTRTAG